MGGFSRTPTMSQCLSWRRQFLASVACDSRRRFTVIPQGTLSCGVKCAEMQGQLRHARDVGDDLDMDDGFPEISWCLQGVIK
jgi:hypothetical protein